MAKNYQTGLIITGSADGAIKATKLTEQALKNLNSTNKRAARESAGAWDKVKAQLFSTRGALGALSTALAGFASLNALRKTIDDIDRIGKMAGRLGTTTEALSELRHVANLSGVDFNQMQTGFQRMTRRISEAAGGTGEAVKALQELGLNAKALKQLRPEDQYERIADAINGLGNQSDKVRIAMRLFDTEGVALIQTMGNGAEGIRKMREEAQRLGLTITQDMADAAAQANDNMARFGATMDSVGLSITNNLLPVINDFFELFDLGKPVISDMELLFVATFATIEKAANTLLATAEKALLTAEAAFKGLVNSVMELLADAVDGIAAGADMIGADDFAASMASFADSMRPATSAADELAAGIADIDERLAANNAAIDDNVTGFFELANQQESAFQAASKFNQAIKQTAPAINDSTNASTQATKIQQAQWDQLVKDANKYYDLRQEIARFSSGDVTLANFEKLLGKVQDYLQEGIIDEAQAKAQFDALGRAFNEGYIEPAKAGIDEFEREHNRMLDNLTYELQFAFDTLLFSGQSFTDALGDMFDNMIDRMLHSAIEFASNQVIRGLFSGNYGQTLLGLGVGAAAIGASYFLGGVGAPERAIDSRTTRIGDDRVLGFAQMVAADIASRDYIYAQQLTEFKEMNATLKHQATILTSSGAVSTELLGKVADAAIGFVPGISDTISGFGLKITDTIADAIGLTITNTATSVAAAVASSTPTLSSVSGMPAQIGDSAAALQNAIPSDFQSLTNVDTSAASRTINNLGSLLSVLGAAYGVYGLVANWDQLSTANKITGVISTVVSVISTAATAATSLAGTAATAAATGISNAVLSAIPVVGWVVTAAIAAYQGISAALKGDNRTATDYFTTAGFGGLNRSTFGNTGGGIVNALTVGPASLISGLFKQRVPHARLKTAFSEGVYDPNFVYENSRQYGDTPFQTKVRGSSARVRINTPLGTTTFGTFNANYSAGDMVDTFGNLLLMIRDTDVAVVEAINNIDEAQGKAGETLAHYYDWLQKQGGRFSPKENLKGLEVADLLQARYDKIIDVISESGTETGIVLDKWFDTISAKLGPENVLSTVTAISGRLALLMQLPEELIGLVDQSVKSYELGGTPEAIVGEVDKVITSYVALSAGLKILGATEFGEEQIVGFLAKINGAGLAVSEAGQSLFEYASVLYQLNEPVGEGIKNLFAYADAQRFTNAQMSDFFSSVGPFTALANKLDLSASLDDLNAVSRIVGDIAKNKLDQAELKSLEDQASQYGGLTVSEARAEIERLGLATGDAILQVTNELVFMNNALEITGSSFNKLGASLLQAVQGTQAFLEKVGGIEEWEKVVNSYFSNFFSEQEQFDYLTNQLTESLAQQNIVLPQTREAYRQLIEGLAKDLASPVAQDAYITLLQLAGQADQYYSAIEAQADQAVQQAEQAAQASRQALEDNLQAAKTMVSEAFSALQASVQREKERVNDLYNAQIDDARAAIDRLSDSVGKLRSLSDSLKSTLRNLDTPDSELVTRRLAQAEISAALATARAGGPLPLDGQLDNALSVISQPSEDLFGSFTDYQRDFYRTANDISALNNITENELSKQVSQIDIAESQLKELQRLRDDEIERLDDILSRAQAQIDAANGTTLAVLSVKSALDGLAQALGAQSAAQQALDQAIATPAVVDSGTVADVAAPTVNPVINDKMIHDPGVKGTLPSVTDQQIQDFVDSNVNNLQAIYDAAILYGVSSSRLAANSPWTQQEILDWTASQGFPAFATGGDHAGGWRVVGERGPELEYTGPSHIYSNRDSQSLINIGELVEELKQLREEVAQLRSETRAGQAAIASNTRKTAKTLDKFDIDGLPEVRA